MNYNRILIIDKNRDTSQFYKQRLEDDGYSIDIADTLGKLIRLLEENLYTLVILDIDFLSLKEYYSLQNGFNDIEKIPLIINADASNLNNQASWFNQADACIPKPSNISALKERIKFVLDEFTTEFDNNNSKLIKEYF